MAVCRAAKPARRTAIQMDRNETSTSSSSSVPTSQRVGTVLVLEGTDSITMKREDAEDSPTSADGNPSWSETPGFGFQGTQLTHDHVT